MSHESTVFLLAVLVALMPFLGFPYSWLMILVPMLGVLIAFFAVLARARRLAEAHPPMTGAPAPSLDETSSAI